MYKIVIVDDETFALEQLCSSYDWNLLGFEVAGAFDSSSIAFDFIKENKIDVLLTDISMPNISGLELAKKCREKYPDMKIVFFSGFRDFDYIKQAMELQAVEYLTKPIDDDDFTATFKKLKAQLDTENQNELCLKQQQILSSLLCGMITDTATLEAQFNEIGIDRQHINTPCALIKLEIPINENPLLSSQHHSQAKLYDSIANILNRENSNAYFMLIRYIIDEFEIMCIQKSTDIDTDCIVSAYFEEISADISAVFSLHARLGTVIRFKSVSNLIGIDIESEPKNSNSMIEKALSFIKDNCGKNISSQTVAYHIGFSPAYFRLYFKKHTGTNFTDYLTELRMQTAREMLINSDLSIACICDKIGYSSRTHFYKKFRSIYKLSPAEYRSKYRPNTTEEKDIK